MHWRRAETTKQQNTKTRGEMNHLDNSKIQCNEGVSYWFFVEQVLFEAGRSRWRPAPDADARRAFLVTFFTRQRPSSRRDF